MLATEALKSAFRIRLTKGAPAAAIDRALILRHAGEAIEVDLRRQGDELAILLSRFAVERFCGFGGILHQLGRGAGLADGPSHSAHACETLKSELLVKTLLDARVARLTSAIDVRDTVLMLLREIQPGAAAKGGAQVGASGGAHVEGITVGAVTSCMGFVERALRSWETLSVGETFELAFDSENEP